MQNDYFTEDILYPREQWFETLMSDEYAKRGHTVLMTLSNGVAKHHVLSERTINRNSSQADVYATINPQICKNSRDTSKTLALKTIYIDVDAHNCKDIYTAKSNIKNAFNRAFGKTMPVPDMITDTGRGYGFFYVLKNCITVAGNSRTEKQENFFYDVYDSMLLRAERVVTKISGVEIDCTVKDRCRVARVPGTINTKCGQKCKLIYIRKENGEQCLSTLTELLSFVGSKKRTRRNTSTTFTFDLTRRVEKMKKLIITRAQKGTDVGHRETMLFIAANDLLNSMCEDNVHEILLDMNEKFSTPLPESEVTHALKSCFSGRDKNNCRRGRYSYGTAKIVSVLNITKEERELCGFMTSRDEKRKSTKEHNRIKREEKYQRMAKMATEGHTYDEIAKVIGCTKALVGKVLNGMGMFRYKTKKTKKIEKQAEPEQKKEEKKPGIQRESKINFFDLQSIGYERSEAGREFSKYLKRNDLYSSRAVSLTHLGCDDPTLFNLSLSDKGKTSGFAGCRNLWRFIQWIKTNCTNSAEKTTFQPLYFVHTDLRKLHKSKDGSIIAPKWFRDVLQLEDYMCSIKSPGKRNAESESILKKLLHTKTEGISATIHNIVSNLRGCRALSENVAYI